MARSREEKLTEEAKVFVVQSLACFDPPSVVVKAIKDDFQVDITGQAIESYDPTKRAGKGVAEKWRLLFWETREAFLKDTAKIGIANRAVRLRALERMAARAEKQGNLALAKDLHEQAAKEVGDVYTNTRKLAGHDGGAIKTEDVKALDLAKATPDQLRAIAARKIPRDNGG